jgi:hypothetical protein
LIRIRARRASAGILRGMSDPDLYPCFLGPYGENDQLLEKLVVEFLRDHVYWRRNFHPEDPPAIPTHAAQLPVLRIDTPGFAGLWVTLLAVGYAIGAPIRAGVDGDDPLAATEPGD